MDDLRWQYKKLLQKYHPDNGGQHSDTQKISGDDTRGCQELIFSDVLVEKGNSFSSLFSQ